MITQKTFTKEDNIFATLMGKGKIIKTIVGKNFSDISEIVKMITSNCGDYRGLAELSVRNQSQGWSFNMLLSMNNVLPTSERIEAEPPRDGLQYCFAF